MSSGLPDVLARIAADRRKHIAALEIATPGHVLRSRLGPLEPAGRLERSLRRGGAAGALKLLCEIKHTSPSKGVLNARVDPAATARIYDAGGAASISVVTEPDHFGGALQWVNAVRSATRLPILLKDFVLDSYQILDAAVRGADAVLLIVAMHSDVALQRLITEARLLGLDALVEVHTLEELMIALRAGSTLIGINNRNLHTLEVDLETSIRLLPHLPPYVTAVAESGLSTPGDLARLRATRCDAVLMGEVFMTSADPAATLTHLAAAARA